MERYKYIQPELELTLNGERLKRRKEALSAFGRFAIDAMSAIGHSITGKQIENEIIPEDDRIVIDLIEGSTAYGSLYQADGQEHQLVFALEGIHIVRIEEN
jgi:hypothetical protein